MSELFLLYVVSIVASLLVFAVPIYIQDSWRERMQSVGAIIFFATLPFALFLGKQAVFGPSPPLPDNCYEAGDSGPPYYETIIECYDE